MELIPLNSEQHVITFVPKLTAELPFFNLTSYQKNLPSVIKFRGIDEAGHPINWEVYQNTNREIGSPRSDAHRVWYQLVKPAADKCRREDGTLPQIIPLGRIRECLRKVGWSAGGHQERKLIRSLNQIGAAWCVADLWIPTNETDERGKPKYVQVKGRFSRLSVYAIGERHVSEEELINLTFAFDLEDVLYIKLDPLEATMQQAADQRLYDNEYWFSVDPAARRWYELMAPKIFGTVKNHAPFCEIRYSWYIQHHHTLKRFYERRRVVEQMNRLIADHLESEYIKAVEYRVVKEPDQELDYIVRYYPGEGAHQSIQRVQTHLRQRRTSWNATSPVLRQRRRNHNEIANPPLFNPFALSVATAHHVDLISRLIVQFGVFPTKAYELSIARPETVMSQLEAWTFRSVEPNNRAGWIIQAIENNYELPKAYLQQRRKQQGSAERYAIDERIRSCLMCDDRGFRHVQTPQYPNGAMRECTHDQNIEKQYQDMSLAIRHGSSSPDAQNSPTRGKTSPNEKGPAEDSTSP